MELTMVLSVEFQLFWSGYLIKSVENTLNCKRIHLFVIVCLIIYNQKNQPIYYALKFSKKPISFNYLINLYINNYWTLNSYK